MSQGLYEGVAAMQSAERRLESIATNLANLGVNGFKRRAATTNGFDVVMRGAVRRQVGTRTVVDFRQGPLQSTGNELDLALSGPGFFAVETERGEAYTRNGQFRIDDAGVLQTLEGYPVAWDGPRGAIDPESVEVRIDPEGNVFQGEQQVGKLRIVDFEQRPKLFQDRGGYYRAPRGLAETAHGAEVRQKTLEAANVNAVDEMVAMISVQRSVESGARLMQMIDQTYRRLTAPR